MGRAPGTRTALLLQFARVLFGVNIAAWGLLLTARGLLWHAPVVVPSALVEAQGAKVRGRRGREAKLTRARPLFGARRRRHGGPHTHKTGRPCGTGIRCV